MVTPIAPTGNRCSHQRCSERVKQAAHRGMSSFASARNLVITAHAFMLGASGRVHQGGCSLRGQRFLLPRQ
jgi:hypothetical protein